MYSLHCSASLDMEVQIPWSSYNVLHPKMAMFLSLMLVVLLLLQQLFLFILTTCLPTHGIMQDALLYSKLGIKDFPLSE